MNTLIGSSETAKHHIVENLTLSRMSECFVQCPRCMGKAWLRYKDESSPVKRKLKCQVCDDKGMAHVQDIIDYYAFISDKAPEDDKVIRWQAYLKMSEKECSYQPQDSAETEG